MNAIAEWVAAHAGNAFGAQFGGDARKCWAGNDTFAGCFRYPTTDIGLCDDHYEEIVGGRK